MGRYVHQLGGEDVGQVAGTHSELDWADASKSAARQGNATSSRARVARSSKVAVASLEDRVDMLEIVMKQHEENYICVQGHQGRGQ